MTTRVTNRLSLAVAGLALAVAAGTAHAQSTSYADSANDINPTIATGGGTLDMLGMEVSNTATDIVFRLTLNGNVSGNNAVDWGKFMIGISTGNPGDSAGNGWGRPISMTSPAGGMDYWIGSWVDGGGGAQLWNYNGSSWSGPGGLSAFSFSGNQITYTLSLSSLGLGVGDTFYFDAFSSGGGNDSAIDALANPNESVSTWGGPYASGGANPIYSYTVVPAPGAIALLGLASGLLARRRRR